MKILAKFLALSAAATLGFATAAVLAAAQRHSDERYWRQV